MERFLNDIRSLSDEGRGFVIATIIRQEGAADCISKGD